MRLSFLHTIFIAIFFTHFRSCQTCRDKITERKRYLSKSREAIFEKVNQSKLKKSLSKSRERLPVCGLTLSKSRDNLGLGLQDSLYPGLGQTKVIFLGYLYSLDRPYIVVTLSQHNVVFQNYFFLSFSGNVQATEQNVWFLQKPIQVSRSDKCSIRR